MLGWMIGTTMALGASVLGLWIMMLVLRAFVGNAGAALVTTCVVLFLAYAGVYSLVTSDHLGIQMLGWLIAAAAVTVTLKGAQFGVRKARAWWDALPVDGLD